jgi:hypothetical protein
MIWASSRIWLSGWWLGLRGLPTRETVGTISSKAQWMVMPAAVGSLASFIFDSFLTAPLQAPDA